MEFNGAPKQPGYKLSLKDLPFCSAEQRNSYRFGTTWLQDFHLWVNYPFKACHFKPLLQPKYGSCITLLLSIEKVILSESGEKYAQIKHRLEAKKNTKQRVDVSLEEALLWIIFWPEAIRFKGKNIGMQLFALQDYRAIDEIINLPKSIPKKTQTHMLLEWPES